MRAAPGLGRHAAGNVSGRDVAYVVRQRPSRKPKCGRLSHSDACKSLARSGLFAREVAHLLLALAREPIDRLFELSTTRMIVFWKTRYATMG